MKPDETPSEPVPEPVHEGQAKEKKETEPIEPVTDETTEAPSDALQEVETLKAELEAKTKDLEAKEAELTAKREPLEGFLMQRGISKDAVEAMKLKDLEIMAQTLQQQQTQGLPGTVPAPPPVHKTDAEILAEADEKASKTLVQKSQEEFKEW